MGNFQEREHHESVIPLELLPGNLNLKRALLDIGAVKALDGLRGLSLYKCFWCHSNVR